MKNQGKNDEEFEQFLDFIIYFCTELTFGQSPEYALVKSINYFQDQSPNPLFDVLKTVVEGSGSFTSALNNVRKFYKDERYSRIIELLGRFIEKGSQLGGTRMLTVLQQIRTNLTLSKNRKTLIDAQRAKVFALAIVSSAVLGMVAGIAPILTVTFIGLTFVNQLLQPPLTITLNVFITLFLTVFVSSYRLTQNVGSSSRILLFCMIAFITTFLLTSNLIASIP